MNPKLTKDPKLALYADLILREEQTEVEEEERYWEDVDEQIDRARDEK